MQLPLLQSHHHHHHHHHHHQFIHTLSAAGAKPCASSYRYFPSNVKLHYGSHKLLNWRCNKKTRSFKSAISASVGPLDLTEENINKVLADARIELGQLFDASVNITGKAELAELDGPYVKLSLHGRFWHKRSTVLARLGNYLKQRIPEILEVEIEDGKQLDDSPENF